MLLPSVRSVKPLQHRTGVSFSRANIVNRVSSYNTRRSVTSLRVSQPERIAKNPVLTSTTNTKLFFQTTKYIQKRYNSEGTDDYMYTIDTPGSNQRTGDEEYTKKKKKKRFGDGRVVHIPFSTTPKGLSSILGISTVEVLKTMIRLGERPTSSNETILGDLADLIAAELRFTPVRLASTQDAQIAKRERPADTSHLPTKAPVVTVMGHINHGKTSLLDAFRNTNVVAGEAGRITQKIGAFVTKLESGASITFMDTPGHEAFSAMRARGAKVTDIALLVVAADEGVAEQTIEAINHIRAAKVPMIVAINKCDKPGANPEQVTVELLKQGVVTEEHGGNVPAVRISALKREGLKDLEDVILSIAEILDLRADKTGPAEGVIIESHVSPTMGPIATVLVTWGTLKVGDYFVAGTTWGKVRKMTDHRSTALKEAPPACAVELMGFKELCEPGEDVIVVESEAKAKAICEQRIAFQMDKKGEELALARRQSEKLAKAAKQPGTATDAATPTVGKPVNVIVKADVAGSIDAITKLINDLPSNELAVKVIHSGTGNITESDLEMAKTSEAFILLFNLVPPFKIVAQAKQHKVTIFDDKVVYGLMEKLKEQLSAMLPPKIETTVTGEAEILQVFDVEVAKNQHRRVAGCYINSGSIHRNSQIRVVRDGEVIFTGKLASLKHHKDDINEAKSNTECGMAIHKFDDIKVGDLIQTFKTREIPRVFGEDESKPSDNN